MELPPRDKLLTAHPWQMLDPSFNWRCSWMVLDTRPFVWINVGTSFPIDTSVSVSLPVVQRIDVCSATPAIHEIKRSFPPRLGILGTAVPRVETQDVADSSSKMFIKLSVIAAIAALVNAAPSPSPLNHVVHEKRDSIAVGWTKAARLEKKAIIPMRIGMTQTNLDKGYDFLMDV